MLGQARTNAYNGTIKICTANTVSLCIYACIGVTYAVEDITTATRIPLFLIIYFCVEINYIYELMISWYFIQFLSSSLTPRWCHFTRTPQTGLNLKSNWFSQRKNSNHLCIHTLVPFNPCCPVLIYGERGSFRHWFQFTVPRLTIQLRLVSHHTSVGAGAEDDTQLGHSTTPRLCFLSSTPLTSLCITTTFPCLFALLFCLLCCVCFWSHFILRFPLC